MGDAADAALEYEFRRKGVFGFPELDRMETYLDRMEKADSAKEERLRRATIKPASRRRASRLEAERTKGKKKVALADFAPEIISLEEDEDTVNLMIYGSAGTGKTVFAGSAPRVLFLAPEDDGTISAKRQGSSAKKWPINSFADMAEALDRIEDNIDELKEHFDWLAVDSITHMQRLTMRQILDDAVEENPDRDPDIPQMQDWQKYQNMFLRFVQAINDLPINVIWTALVRSEEDEEGEEFLVPDIQGKGYQMAMTVASYMTSYGCIKNREVPIRRNGDYVLDSNGDRKTKTVREITWRDTGKIRGKDRTDALSPSTKDLTLDQIDKLITGEATREDFAPKKVAKKAPAKAATAKKPAAKRAARPEVKANSEAQDESDGPEHSDFAHDVSDI